MGLKVGVVCEGSHDYNVLKRFISQIIREYGETLDTIECLQPTVSATFQVGAGGWAQVRAWCMRNGGQGYRVYLDKPLFATSIHYDILVLHLDGDVVTHCDSEPLSGVRADTMSVSEIITAIKSAIRDHWLKIEEHHEERIVVAAPVRHLEAWLSAAIGPALADHEIIDTKELFRAGPASSYSGEWREKYIVAATVATTRTDAIKRACLSYRTFEADLRASAESA